MTMHIRTLRPHQTEAIEKLRQSLRTGHRRPLIQAPTGFGKSVLAGHIVNGALAKGNEVTITVPSISLVDQMYSSLFADGVYDIGVMQANHPQTNPKAPVQIASLDTLRRRQLPKSGLVLVDEAHRRSKFLSEWMRLPEWERIPFVGLSATPWTKGLGKDFDDLIIAETTASLIEKGYLSPFIAFGSEEKPDLSNVGTVAEDFNQGQLATEMQKPKLVADVVQTWLEKGENRPTLCFAVDCAHAKTLREQFERAGVSTAYVDAFTDRGEREQIRRRFQSGDVKIVCNVGVCTTGIDWDVRCIILARPTKSEILYVQIIGRGLRTADGKDHLIILDHSDTTARLGFVTDILHDTLNDGKPKTASERKKEEDERKERLPKDCPHCGMLVPVFAKKCPNCGFEVRRPSKIECAQGELKQLTGKKTEYTATEKQKWYKMLRYLQEENGRKYGWVAHQYKEKFGVWPKFRSNLTLEPTEEVRNFVKAKAIAYAKANKAPQVTQPHA
jgi:DNA repair protein RadD